MKASEFSHATAWMIRESRFNFPCRWGGDRGWGVGKTLLSLQKAMRPTQPPIKRLVGASMPGIRGWGIMVTTQTMLQVEKAWRCNSTRRQFIMCCDTNPLSFQNYDVSGDDL